MGLLMARAVASGLAVALACCGAAGSSAAAPVLESRGLQDAPAQGASPEAKASSAASQLAVEVGENLGFFFTTGPAGDDRITDVVERGIVSEPFRCGSGRPEAVDPEEVAVRRLLFARAADTTESLFDHFKPVVGAWADDTSAAQLPKLQITDARLQVVLQGPSNGLPVLHAALLQPLPNGTYWGVPLADDGRAELVVLYDCWDNGQAIIELQLTVLSGDEGEASEEICMRWNKRCAVGAAAWRHLEIVQGETPVLVDGEVQQSWLDLFREDGTDEKVTKLQLSATGTERLRTPVVTSSSKFLKVEIRGPLYSGDGEEESVEIGPEAVDFSVMYTCESDGLADVVLRLEKAVLSGTHRPEEKTITWKKRCGTTAYKHLTVTIKSDNSQNKSVAVVGGAVLRPFMRPCRSGGGGKGSGGTAAAASASAGGAAGSAGSASEPEMCQADQPMLEIAASEGRTSLELQVAPEAASTPPVFQPLPDISYDKKILQVKIAQNLRGPMVVKHRSQSQSRTQILAVKYTCLKDGVSVIMVTLHILGHRTIDVAWRKRCVEPKARVGRALTAPQAMVITCLILVIFGVVMCCLWVCCGRDGRQARSKYEHVGVELSGMNARARRRDGSEGEVIGAHEDNDGEITFH